MFIDGNTIQNGTHLIKIVHLIVRLFNSVSFQIKMFFIILITIILSKHKYTKKCCLLNRRLETILVRFISDLVFTLRAMKPAQCRVMKTVHRLCHSASFWPHGKVVLPYSLKLGITIGVIWQFSSGSLEEPMYCYYPAHPFPSPANSLGVQVTIGNGAPLLTLIRHRVWQK